MVKEANNEQEYDEIFNKAVDDGTLLIIDFYTTWCGPCKRLKPVFEKLDQKYKENSKVMFLTVDVQENEDVGDRYEILSIPTIKIFKDGVELKEVKGFQDEDFFDDMIKTYVDKNQDEDVLNINKEDKVLKDSVLNKE